MRSLCESCNGREKDKWGKCLRTCGKTKKKPKTQAHLIFGYLFFNNANSLQDMKVEFNTLEFDIDIQIFNQLLWTCWRTFCKWCSPLCVGTECIMKLVSRNTLASSPGNCASHPRTVGDWSWDLEYYYVGTDTMLTLKFWKIRLPWTQIKTNVYITFSMIFICSFQPNLMWAKIRKENITVFVGCLNESLR